MSELSTDLAILGAGPGGYVAAIRAAQLGLKVAIIEKEKLGGVCLNIGCIPSKALIHQAEVFKHAKEAESLGVKLDLSGFDYSRVFKKSRSAADRLSKGVGFLMKKNGIQVVNGTGSIVGPGRIEVSSAEDKTSITAKDIIIATGSRPRSIPGFDFDENFVLSSTGALMLKELPKRLAILGAGAIGCEFAHVMNSFGTKVTLVEMLDQILPAEDPEAAKILAEDFKKRKIDIHVKTRALGFKKSSKGVSIELEGPEGNKNTVEADKLLVVVGRTPNTEEIGLEKLGIETKKGFIPVGKYYQTSIEHVYAIGDVIETPLLAHVASKEGEIAVEHIAGHSPVPGINPEEIPSAVYTEPEIASFGLSREKAILKGFPADEIRFPYRGSGKAVATDAAGGMVKIVYDSGTKEILGAHIAGSKATEIIHEILLAKSSELLPEDIASMIHAHPTLSETVMESMKMIGGAAVHI